MNNSYIEIKDLVLLCHLGVPSKERGHRQKVFVSIKIFADYSLSEESDKITDTIDYSDIINEIDSLVETRTFSLIENLAGEVRKTVKRLCNATKVDVTVRKPNVIQHALYVAYSSIE